MDGILERLIAAINANTAAILGQAPAANPVAPAILTPAIQAVAQLTPAPASVTGDQITALIQPHIGNETIKTALGVAMRAMGINALPETQPHQFVPLYQAFQAVIAAHTGGAGQTTPAPSASII